MIALVLALACSGGRESADPCADVPYDLTWANWGDGFFASYCRACHSAETADRWGAPEGVDFDTLQDVRDWEERIRVRVLEEGTMPLGGGVYEEDLEFLGYFLDCGL